MSIRLQLRKAVWHSMLRAEMNVEYWRQLGRRYYNSERIAKFLLLATSSSTVASWGFWSQVEVTWKCLSVVSALLAIAMPVLNWNKHIAACADLYGRWLQLASEHEKLWIQLEGGATPADQIEKTFDMIRTKTVDVSKAEAQQGIKRRLLRLAYDDVLKSRGLRK